jgi:hypothetical protein
VLERRLREASSRLKREHHARAAVEAQMRVIFGRPVVRDALRSHVEGEGGGGEGGAGKRSVMGDDQDGSETAMQVFKAGLYKLCVEQVEFSLPIA